MEKQYAINLLGGNVTNVAEMLGYSRQAIHQWADPLTTRLEALVMYHYAKLPPSQKRKNKAKAEAAGVQAWALTALPQTSALSLALSVLAALWLHN